MLFENIISMGNVPLSDFSFLWNRAKTVDSQSFSFCSVLISRSQRCVQAFQVTDVYVKLIKIGFLETQLFRYYIQLVVLNMCP